MTHFTVREACLLCDALNGTWMHGWEGEQARQYFVLEIEDAIRLNQADETWKVNGRELVRKLREMTPPEATELPRLVERFWETQSGLNLRDAIMQAFRGWIDDSRKEVSND